MFPEQPRSGRFRSLDWLLGKAAQLAKDALSAQGKPIPDSLPESDRPEEIWVDTDWEPRWGHAMQLHYEGVPITFYPSQVVNPRVHSGYGPFVQYPPISRGDPVPYGNTVPVLGEG